MYKIGDIVILFNPKDNRAGYIKNITRNGAIRRFDIIEFGNGIEHKYLMLGDFSHYE